MLSSGTKGGGGIREFVQCLIVLALFFGVIFIVYISYKVKVRVENIRDNTTLQDEVSVDLNIKKKNSSAPTLLFLNTLISLKV